MPSLWRTSSTPTVRRAFHSNASVCAKYISLTPQLFQFPQNNYSYKLTSCSMPQSLQSEFKSTKTGCFRELQALKVSLSNASATWLVRRRWLLNLRSLFEKNSLVVNWICCFYVANLAPLRPKTLDDVQKFWPCQNFSIKISNDACRKARNRKNIIKMVVAMVKSKQNMLMVIKNILILILTFTLEKVCLYVNTLIA